VERIGFHAVVELGRWNLRRRHMKAPEAIECRAQGERSVPERVVESVDDTILGTEAKIEQSDRAVATHVRRLAAREIDGLARGRRCASRLESEFGAATQEFLDRVLAQILGGREELAEVGGRANPAQVQAKLLESSPVERRSRAGKPQKAAKLLVLDARNDR